MAITQRRAGGVVGARAKSCLDQCGAALGLAADDQGSVDRCGHDTVTSAPHDRLDVNGVVLQPAHLAVVSKLDAAVLLARVVRGLAANPAAWREVVRHDDAVGLNKLKE